MNLKDKIKQKILGFLGLQHLSQNPNDERLTYISNDEAIKQDELKANRVWYIGSGDELLNYYTQKQVIGFNDNPIYNRNKRNYFWSLSAEECDIKRIHSGIPNAIVTTLSNAIGVPSIECEGWEEIAKENDFNNKLVQQARPLTMVEGYGAWKVNFNKDISPYPLWEFYEGEFVEFIVKQGILIGIIFKSYYKDAKDKDYVLLETRYRKNGSSYIEYNLYRLLKGNTIEEVDVHYLPELADIPTEPVVIPNFNRILAVPNRYLYDPMNPKYGRSIYSGKLDLFDMLDEIISQASQTNRVSTPVEYYSPDVLERGPNGMKGAPRLYNRQFVSKESIPDGEGNVNNDIQTTQPDLNFEKYGGLAKDVLDYIFTGMISPSTLGIDVAKKDNAEAQREKEKITLLMRNSIISNETITNREIVDLSIRLKAYMETGLIPLEELNINIKYTEFANPSFENQIQILGSAWSSGEISTERYVDLLWGDKLSEEDKAKEIMWLDNNRKDMSGLLGEQDVDAETAFDSGDEFETIEEGADNTKTEDNRRVL